MQDSREESKNHYVSSQKSISNQNSAKKYDFGGAKNQTFGGGVNQKPQNELDSHSELLCSDSNAA